MSEVPPQSPPNVEHPEIVRFPLMELPVVGFLLAFMAGSMNAWTFANAETFATVQSGNVVQIGYWLVQANWDKFIPPFLSVIAFGVGSAICGVIMTKLLSHHRIVTRAILFLEFLILAVLIWLIWKGNHNVWMIAYAVSFVAGMQGNAFHKTHGMLYGNVAVTFVVQMAFNFLIQGLFNKKGINGEPNLMWAGVFFLVLFGFAGGGAIGFFIDRFVTAGALIIPALISLVLIVIVWRDHDRHKRVDTLPGGSFA